MLCFNNALGKSNHYLQDLSAGDIYIYIYIYHKQMLHHSIENISLDYKRLEYRVSTSCDSVTEPLLLQFKCRKVHNKLLKGALSERKWLAQVSSTECYSGYRVTICAIFLRHILARISMLPKISRFWLCLRVQTDRCMTSKYHTDGCLCFDRRFHLLTHHDWSIMYNSCYWSNYFLIITFGK